MKINIHETLMNLNRGRISVDQAHDEIESAMCEANACPQLADVRAIVEKHLCPDGYIKNDEFEMERVMVEWLYKDDIEALIKELSEHFG